ARRIARAGMNAYDPFAFERRESAVLAECGSILIRHRKLETVVLRRIAERCGQPQPSMHLGVALGVLEEARSVRVLSRGIVETGRHARAEQRGERVAHASAAVHLERKIERCFPHRSPETLAGDCAERPFVGPGKSREEKQRVEQAPEALDHPSAFGQPDQLDVRRWIGSPQRTQSRDRAKHVAKAVQSAYDGDSRGAVQVARTSARGADPPRRPVAANIRSSVCNPSRTVPGVFAKAENASIMPRAILAR